MAYKKYDDKLKQDVIETVLEGHRSAAQVAIDYNVPKTAVYSWIRAHKLEHNLAVLPLNNETPEQQIKRLTKELAQARLEREILEKATAYFASLKK
jgi:transposase